MRGRDVHDSARMMLSSLAMWGPSDPSRALAQMAERRVRAAKRSEGRTFDGLSAEIRPAHVVGHLNQHRKSTVVEMHTVGDSNTRGFVHIVAMRVKHLRRGVRRSSVGAY